MASDIALKIAAAVAAALADATAAHCFSGHLLFPFAAAVRGNQYAAS